MADPKEPSKDTAQVYCCNTNTNFEEMGVTRHVTDEWRMKTTVWMLLIALLLWIITYLITVIASMYYDYGLRTATNFRTMFYWLNTTVDGDNTKKMMTDEHGTPPGKPPKQRRQSKKGRKEKPIVFVYVKQLAYPWKARSDSMIPKTFTDPCRYILKLFVASPSHPEIYECFRSYPAIVAERQRQQYEGHTYVIHPLSWFCFMWNSFMIPVRLLHIFASHFRLALNVPPVPLKFEVIFTDYIIATLDMFCLLDIVIRFNMGYVGPDFTMILNRRRIASHYLRRWFIPDLLTSIPFAYFMLRYGWHSPVNLLTAHVLAMFKLLRIFSVLQDLKTFSKLFFSSYVWLGVVRQVTMFIVITHLCCCYLYICPIVFLYRSGYTQQGYARFLHISESADKITSYDSVPLLHRYRTGLYISLSAFFGASYHTMFALEWPDEIAVISTIIVFTSIFMIYNLVFIMKVYFTLFDSTMRYYELMNEVEAYMRQKQFPGPLKRRVIAFYEYTFHEMYFREDNALNYLSEQLRNEITLQTCHKLVNKVSLFDGVPASVVGEILGRLHPEVFLPNDLVVRALDIGTCMYFIANGCVAVYSLKGVEVCHLEDGAHFGEVALIMKDRKRTASVVAVEITQVYRLDEADFRHFLMSSPVLFERVETLASKRMHETVLLDEQFRRERERMQLAPDEQALMPSKTEL